MRRLRRELLLEVPKACEKMNEEVLIICNGKEMTVRRVGPVKVRLLMRRRGPPLKPCGWRLVDDVTASMELRALADSGYYEEEISG